MTFWQFADRRLEHAQWPRARTIAGAGVFLLTVLILAMIYDKPELADNDLFKTLAQAIVVQGLVGLAMAFWFTAKERDGVPQPVEVTNDPDKPVPVDTKPEPEPTPQAAPGRPVPAPTPDTPPPPQRGD